MTTDAVAVVTFSLVRPTGSQIGGLVRQVVLTHGDGAEFYSDARPRSCAANFFQLSPKPHDRLMFRPFYDGSAGFMLTREYPEILISTHLGCDCNAADGEAQPIVTFAEELRRAYTAAAQKNTLPEL